MNIYKLVSEDLKSIFAQGEHVVQYKIGEAVKPKIGLLFASNNLAYLLSKKKQFPGSRVFKCDAEMVDFQPRIVPAYSADIELFWRNPEGFQNPWYRISGGVMPLVCVEKSTVFCETITLKEEMK